jgi:hypothetical protein
MSHVHSEFGGYFPGYLGEVNVLPLVCSSPPQPATQAQRNSMLEALLEQNKNKLT